MKEKNRQLQSHSSGFTIIEVMVSVAIFALLAMGAIGAVAALQQSVKAAREKTELASLVAADLEIVRNLPYVSVGTVNGNPSGSLPDLNNPKSITIEGRNYSIYYEVTYYDDPADGTALLSTDTAPADYKQVKMFIKNNGTGNVTTILTNVSPKGLEGVQSAGALLLKVFNAQGQPVSGASIHITNTALTPNIILDRTTDSSGNWVEVGLPPSVNGYHITVTKTGYSSDQTYPITPQNPNPIKPDATVLVGQVTQVSFAIDLVANLTIKTLDQKCQNLNGVGVNVSGTKLIGTNPNVLKFNQNFSSVNGQIALTNIEWDTYIPALLAGQGLMVYGTSPIQQIDVLPGTSQTFTLVLGPQTTNSFLVIVKDAATGAALEGAQVHLQKGGSNAQDYYGITGGSVLNQIDWTGGSGQADFTNTTQYFVDDGNVDINSIPTGLRLKKTAGDYASSGWLESSTFDTGANTTNYTTLTWAPSSQDPATTLKFQIAANNDNATWNYLGPDGTAGTYYTVSGSNISSALDNSRYARYRVFLSTTDTKSTPILTSVNINYVSGCFSPGQSIFTSLTSGNNYNLDVSLSGYQTYTNSSFTINGNQTLEVLLSQ
jgi:prepilin-type N-terminal cleavage/methylation domain-containing protein